VAAGIGGGGSGGSGGDGGAADLGRRLLSSASELGLRVVFSRSTKRNSPPRLVHPHERYRGPPEMLCGAAVTVVAAPAVEDVPAAG